MMERVRGRRPRVREAIWERGEGEIAVRREEREIEALYMITDHYYIACSQPYSYLTNLLITPTHRSATNQQLTLATNSTVVSWCNLFLCEKTIPSPHIISIGNVVE